MGAPRADFAAGETRKQKRKRKIEKKRERKRKKNQKSPKSNAEILATSSCRCWSCYAQSTICAQPGTGYPRNLGLFPPDETEL